MIDVENLNVVFGHARHGVHAVRGVTFRVEEGESFGLVGESGSGKSTVLRAITGILGHTAHTSGRMQVAGEDIGRHRSPRFRRRVQMVFQDPFGSLHPRHTVDQIVSEPARIHRMSNIESRVLRGLEEVGLDASFRFRYPHQISGGQRQRVAVARALITEPEIILLDEPTSALDVSVQAEVLNLLTRLQRERGLTYILVSHNLAVVGHMCGGLAVMQNGEVVETMTVAQLRDNTPTHPYTKRLMLASRGYDRSSLVELEEDSVSVA